MGNIYKKFRHNTDVGFPFFVCDFFSCGFATTELDLLLFHKIFQKMYIVPYGLIIDLRVSKYEFDSYQSKLMT